MSCKITDRTNQITTKKVDGKPVRIVVQKATRKCSDNLKALDENPEELEQCKEEELIVDNIKVEGKTNDRFLAFNNEVLNPLFERYTKNYFELWKEFAQNA